jgi:hypothetical protein
MQVNPAYLRHIWTKECQTGVEQRIQQESAVSLALALHRLFSIHGNVLERVKIFIYLGCLLAQDNNNGQAIWQQMRKAQGVWAHVGQVLCREKLPQGWLLSFTKQSSKLSYYTEARCGISPNRPWQSSRVFTYAQRIEKASTMEGCQRDLGLSKDKGRSGRMRHAYACRIYPGPPSDDRDVRCNKTNLDGLYGGQAAARVDTTSVVVGATDVLRCNRQCNWIEWKRRSLGSVNRCGHLREEDCLVTADYHDLSEMTATTEARQPDPLSAGGDWGGCFAVVAALPPHG